MASNTGKAGVIVAPEDAGSMEMLVRLRLPLRGRGYSTAIALVLSFPSTGHAQCTTQPVPGIMTDTLLLNRHMPFLTTCSTTSSKIW